MKVKIITKDVAACSLTRKNWACKQIKDTKNLEVYMFESKRTTKLAELGHIIKHWSGLKIND